MLPTWSQATSQSSRDRELALRAALHDISDILTYLCRLTSILVARFQLDLQAAYRHSTGHDTAPGSDADAPGTTSLVFERVVGSLGASSGVFMEDDDEFGQEDRENEHSLENMN